MLKPVEGVYRNGKVELRETPSDVDEARVIVIFLPGAGPVDLRELGIDEAQAADLRARLRASPETGSDQKWMPTMPYSR